MSRSLAAAWLVALLAAVAGCDRMQGEPPPRRFMQGGVWFPAATGYWFHQYAERDEIGQLMQDLDFTCNATQAGTSLHCERGFRIPGILSRVDSVEFTFRRNGAIAFAESGCRFAFFGSRRLSGVCAPFAAKGAIFPNVESFAATAAAMLRPAPMHEPISVYRLPSRAAAPLPDASVAVDLLTRWRFECETPRQHSTVGFRGNTGEIHELRCQQWSLATRTGAPQSQKVVIRYDSSDLAVLQVSAGLDDAAVPLSATFNTVRDPNARATERDRAAGAPASLTLETNAGERFEMPMNAVGTGSRQATREGFIALTPDSQRLLIQAYLDKRWREWGGKLERLSYASLGALEWYEPDALPHLDALASDERPELGAAILKYRCLEEIRRGEPSFDPDRVAPAMVDCLDERRAKMPRSIAALDRLLARDLRALAGSNAGALNAFFDFRRDVLYVYALGPDGKESRVALNETVTGKEGLDPNLERLVAAALAQHDRPLVAR